MKSHAALLAEIEENRRKNKHLSPKVDELRILESDLDEGCDPYDYAGKRAARGRQAASATPRGR